MRGKALGGHDAGEGLGITPAYAGKSFLLNFEQLIVKDHPRICGEKSLVLIRDELLKGSPPHMRGKDLIFEIVHRVLGITPAYAGKRCGRASATRSTRDHPRICGEKIAPDKEIAREWGSPPHMRGKAG